jgi:hypothetical protein
MSPFGARLHRAPRARGNRPSHIPREGTRSLAWAGPGVIPRREPVGQEAGVPLSAPAISEECPGK